MSGDGSFDDPFEPWEAIRWEYKQRLAGRAPWWDRPRAHRKVGREKRQEALKTIFEILEPPTCRDRLLAMRIILHAISDYHRQNRLSTVEKSDAWFGSVARHANALATLAEQDPEMFGWAMGSVEYREARHVIDDLRLLAWYAVDRGRLRSLPPGVSQSDIERQDDHALACRHWRPPAPQGPRRRSRDRKPIDLIAALEPLYSAATGRDATRNEYELSARKHGETIVKPDPFFLLMRAVWELAGIRRGDDAIKHHIRAWRSERIPPERR